MDMVPVQKEWHELMVFPLIAFSLGLFRPEISLNHFIFQDLDSHTDQNSADK
jgi:hypothetical protein